VRGYALTHAAALSALIGTVAFIDRPSWRPLTLYVAAALVAVYSHTTMILFVALVGVTVLVLIRRSRRAVGLWVGANALVLAGWSWWASITVRQVHMPHGTIDWIARPSFVDALTMTTAVYLPAYKFAIGPLTLLLLAALVIAVAWLAWVARRPAVTLFATLVVVAPIALFAISQVRPIFLERTLFWANGPVLVLVALAMARLGRSRERWLTLGMLVVLEAAFLAKWLTLRDEEHWPTALQAIAAVKPDAVVMVEGDAMAVTAAHYLPLAPHLRIVALVPRPGEGDSWGAGLYPGPHVDAAGGDALLRTRGEVFTLVRADHDPAWALRRVGRVQPWPGASDGGQPFVFVWRARG
jgi:hypothetical protein